MKALKPVFLCLTVLLLWLTGCSASEDTVSETESTVSIMAPVEGPDSETTLQPKTTLTDLEIVVHDSDLLRLRPLTEDVFYEIALDQTIAWQDRNGNPAPREQFSGRKFVTLSYAGQPEGPFSNSRYVLSAEQVVFLRLQEEAQELIHPFADLNLEEVDRVEVMMNFRAPPDYQAISLLEMSMAVAQLKELAGTEQPDPDLEIIPMGAPSTLRLIFTDSRWMEVSFAGSNYSAKVETSEDTNYYCFLSQDYQPLLDLMGRIQRYYNS